MTQPIIPVTQPATVYTVGEQGPPGIGFSFATVATVAFAQSGATLVSGSFTAIDTRGGPVVVNLPVPQAGAFVGLGDLYANAALNPIVIQAQGAGTVVADPSNRGSFSALVHVAAPGGPTVWFAYVLGINTWIPVWW